MEALASPVCLAASQWAVVCCGISLRPPQSCLVSLIADGGVLLRKPERSHLARKLLVCLLPIARAALCFSDASSCKLPSLSTSLYPSGWLCPHNSANPFSLEKREGGGGEQGGAGGGKRLLSCLETRVLQGTQLAGPGLVRSLPWTRLLDF